MKKILMLALVFVLSFSVLAACGGNNAANNTNNAGTTNEGGTDSPADTTGLSGDLLVLTNRTDLVNDGTMDAYAAAFNEKYPDVNVEFEGLTNYVDDVQVRLTTGEVGDVLLIPDNIAAKDYPSFFEALPDEMFENMYFPDRVAHEGKRYGLTTGVSTEGIVYNKKAFEQAGITDVPQTLDDLYAAAQKLKDAGITPFYINYGAQWPMKQWGEVTVQYRTGDNQYLSSMVNEEAPFQADNAWGQTFDIVRTLIDKGYVEEDLLTNNWEASKVEIAEGRAGMYYLGNWVINQVIGAGAAPEDIGFFPMPYDNSGTLYAPLSGDWNMGISKNSDNKEAAKAWVEFFIKESGYVETSGFIPVDKTKEPVLPQLQEHASFNPTYLEMVPTVPQWNEIGNKAQIGFWSGNYIQEIAVAEDYQAELDKLNEKWARAKKDLGY
jgi:raffinose/stachyose/melibiose transport system substrate-binding protein